METKNIVTIMDIDFVNTTKKGFVNDYVLPRLDMEKKCFIVTANPEIVMRAREDQEYKQVIQSADYVIPDGIGIIKASNRLKQPLKERITGFDVVLDLLAYANEKELSCYFLGAKEDVNKKAVEEVTKQFPNLRIAGRHHGFFDLKDESIIEEVVKSEADIVLVALGLPRQELWIHNTINRFEKGVFLGVGGTLDVLAGEVPRAPKMWIKLNLEWLYRVLKQPTRVKRLMKNFEFMFRIILKRS
ncbi:WecB/TagA/CpsF family glycosyltransferase [Paucisalibacillus globulus]|uniref:WecB/TagA/CpsF family glycosyltransferase n=1 Tax=Paucisalibacillus globulus TaxID=351095 RepID=UPI00040578FA|nr:WecB/TagA/CpsF family glycosyltransferase [Paucisalibacillus globulus]